MRLLHTSDWHLGRLFHQVHLTRDQAHVLDQIVEIAARRRPDALLHAGDVFDRAVPPAEAVALLGDVLDRIVSDLGIPVVLISGNHDSAERLSFGARLLARGGLHLATTFEAALAPIVLADEHGPVHVHALPYLEPAHVRQALGRDDLHTHDAATRAAVEAIRARVPAGVRSVLVAHAFVAGGAVADSERLLSVGGSGTVGADAFDGFDYVALGHLHRPQRVRSDRIVYAGSLLKYSFSEADDKKSVAVVEMDAAGACAVARVPLVPRRETRVVEGNLEALLAGADENDRDDYVHIRLLDTGALLDPMGRLRRVYPNALSMERVRPRGTGDDAAAGRGDHRKRTCVDLFSDFYEQVTGEPVTEAQHAELARVVERVERDGDAERAP